MIDDAKLYTDIGNKLKTIRVEKKINQDQVAEKLSLSRTSIINFEKGNQRISLHVLYQYCEYLNVSVNEILPEIKIVPSNTTDSVELAVEKIKGFPLMEATLSKYTTEG